MIITEMFAFWSYFVQCFIIVRIVKKIENILNFWTFVIQAVLLLHTVMLILILGKMEIKSSDNELFYLIV